MARKAKPRFAPSGRSSRVTIHVTTEGEIFLDQKTIYIKLASVPYSQKIAEVIKYNGASSLLMKRKREKHLLSRTSSYGFNDFVIQTAASKYVLLVDNYGTYHIPIEIIKRHGRYMHFKNAGLERQVFIALHVIEAYRQKEISSY